MEHNGQEVDTRGVVEYMKDQGWACVTEVEISYIMEDGTCVDDMPCVIGWDYKSYCYSHDHYEPYSPEDFDYEVQTYEGEEVTDYIKYDQIIWMVEEDY